MWNDHEVADLATPYVVRTEGLDDERFVEGRDALMYALGSLIRQAEQSPNESLLSVVSRETPGHLGSPPAEEEHARLSLGVFGLGVFMGESRYRFFGGTLSARNVERIVATVAPRYTELGGLGG